MPYIYLTLANQTIHGVGSVRIPGSFARLFSPKVLFNLFLLIDEIPDNSRKPTKARQLAE